MCISEEKSSVLGWMCYCMQLGVYDENKNVQVLTNKDQIMATSDDADYKFQKVYKPNVIHQSPTIFFLFFFFLLFRPNTN